MKIVDKEKYKEIYPDEGFLLARKGESNGSTLLILGAGDSPGNYEEIPIPEKPPDPVEVDLDGLKDALIQTTRTGLQEKMMELLQPHIEEYAGQIAEEQSRIEAQILSAESEEELKQINERSETALF